MNTSWRRLEDVFSVTFFCLPVRLQDVFKTCLQDVFLKTSWRHLEEDVLKTSGKEVLKMCWRRLEDLFGRNFANTSWRRLGRWKSALTKLILRYRQLSDTLEGYNKRTKGDSILMTFFYYKLHMELSNNKKHEELILRWNFLSLKKCMLRMDKDRENTIWNFQIE